jgi:hypothetical protein
LVEQADGDGCDREELSKSYKQFRGICYRGNADHLSETCAFSLFQRQRRDELNWPNTVALLLLHIGAAAAVFMFNWPGFAVAAFLVWLTTGLGISMG